MYNIFFMFVFHNYSRIKNVLLLKRQIQFVKDQQTGINAKLDAECFALEEQMNSLRLEVSVHHCCVETITLVP